MKRRREDLKGKDGFKKFCEGVLAASSNVVQSCCSPSLLDPFPIDQESSEPSSSALDSKLCQSSSNESCPNNQTVSGDEDHTESERDQRSCSSQEFSRNSQKMFQEDDKPETDESNEMNILIEDLINNYDPPVQALSIIGTDNSKPTPTTLPAPLVEQWKSVAPFTNFTKVPGFLTPFFQDGICNRKMNNITQVLQFLDHGSNNQAEEPPIGIILKSFFLLEFCIKIPTVTAMINFYEASRFITLHSSLKKLVSAMTMYKLQKDIRHIDESLKIPDVFNSNLDFSPLLESATVGTASRDSTAATLPLEDNYLRQIERVLIETIQNVAIFSMDTDQKYANPEKEKTATAAAAAVAKVEAAAKVEAGVAVTFDKATAEIIIKTRRFCVSLVKEVIQSIGRGLFDCIYNTMIRTCIEQNVGALQHYLTVTNKIGITSQIKMFPYNAALHGIPPVDPSNIPVIETCASSSEIDTILDLIHTNKPDSHYSSGAINLAVYKIAKSLGVVDIKKFLFNSKRLTNYITQENCRDLLIISAKERFEDLFIDETVFKVWLRPEDRWKLLQGLCKDEVIWMLNRRFIPFRDELEVYSALVNWALSECGLGPVVKDRFKNFATQEAKVYFNTVYQESLCLLDLSSHYCSLLHDHFIPKNVIQSALKFQRQDFLNPTNAHPSFRHRQ